MSDHHHHHPELVELRTTLQVLRKTTSSLTSRPFTFLFLSLLVFSFRSTVELATTSVTSFIDLDPSLRLLLSRLDLSPSSAPSPRRRRPFLHLSRLGTLHDDFFSGDDDPHHHHHHHRSVFNSRSDRITNGTLVILSSPGANSGFSDLAGDFGVRVSQVVRPGVTFLAVDESDGGDLDRGRDRDRDVRRDVALLLFVVSFLSAAYGWVILGFLVTYSWVLGIVFVGVVSDLLGVVRSFSGLVWDGSRLGLRRLSGFILMRWAVRDALTQLVGLWYFGEVEDQYSFFKLFVRLKLMPFSVMAPWIRGYEREVSGFLFTWFVFDTVVGFVFSVDAWVALVDSRKSGREIVKEGCYLLSMMMNQAIQLKCLEAMFCGSFVRWVLAQACGKSVAGAFQAVVEVYFMAAWLVFYLAARCRDADADGRRFGQRELEGLVEGLR